MELLYLVTKNKPRSALLTQGMVVGKTMSYTYAVKEICTVLNATSEQAVPVPGLQARARASLGRSSVGINSTSIGFVYAV